MGGRGGGGGKVRKVPVPISTNGKFHNIQGYNCQICLIFPKIIVEEDYLKFCVKGITRFSFAVSNFSTLQQPHHTSCLEK